MMLNVGNIPSDNDRKLGITEVISFSLSVGHWYHYLWSFLTNFSSLHISSCIPTNEISLKFMLLNKNDKFKESKGNWMLTAHCSIGKVYDHQHHFQTLKPMLAGILRCLFTHSHFNLLKGSWSHDSAIMWQHLSIKQKCKSRQSTSLMRDAVSSFFFISFLIQSLGLREYFLWHMVMF